MKKIYGFSESTGDDLVSLGDLAQSLGVTPGTVTTMMKSLADDGLVEYRPRVGVLLTEKGKDAALAVVRRHRLIELFLVEIIGLDWSEVHEEAEILEHAISTRLLNRIDEMLGHPTTDPHGDPIPAADGSFAESSTIPLSEAGHGKFYEVVQVAHDDPGFLNYLTQTGLVPGARIEIMEHNPSAETLTIRSDNGETAISFSVAGKLRVRST